MGPSLFDPDIERALRLAEIAHRGQKRKGLDSVPYVVHPIHCALMLSRLGYPTHVIQAALLHDIVEDCEGWSFERVEREFGRSVAAVVAELTEDKTKSWEERKLLQVEHVASMSADALAVKAADKLHNLATLAADLEAAPDPAAIWDRFKGGRDRTLAMSRALVDALAPKVDARLGNALKLAIAELELHGSR
jgi:(p)ppGpp synthase/HD superfamily hydrolase